MRTAEKILGFLWVCQIFTYCYYYYTSTRCDDLGFFEFFFSFPSVARLNIFIVCMCEGSERDQVWIKLGLTASHIVLTAQILYRKTRFKYERKRIIIVFEVQWGITSKDFHFPKWTYNKMYEYVQNYLKVMLLYFYFLDLISNKTVVQSTRALLRGERLCRVWK